ncbi:tudor domain-containing protein 7 isoform X2 [Anoplophora glabripennis]|uniref:tudor domain-containing protein 7 isoform X2 n=1 Tax=Anoplophora glabripennis TaxID=217634 RepID=UPI0008749045|nr:tudor domain-containing protein 7 isoform X2 [Anoplophora glabripennis]
MSWTIKWSVYTGCFSDMAESKSETTQENLRNEVISGVRACLISTKGKVELRQLDNDYRTLIGERIPYFKLGFKRLEDFIQSVPTLVISKGVNGETFVDAKICQKSAHITEMVQKQKQDKKKVSFRKMERFTLNGAPANPSNWRPKNVGAWGRRHYHNTPPRLAKVSHNQFIDRSGYNKPSVASKIVVPETSNLYPKYNPNLQRQNSEPPRNVSTNSRLHLVSQVSQDAGQSNGKQEPCSLSSTKKRITQKMSELSIERQVSMGRGSPVSENSSTASTASSPTFDVPLQDVPLPKAIEFVPVGDPVVDLKNFVELNKIGQLEVSSKLMKTKRNRMYTCRIKIGKHTYTSYPEEFDSPIAAERFCSEDALKDLIHKYGKKSLLLASDKDILERIPPMLEKHHHGIWGWQLQLDYADKYNEQLPADWLKVIDSSPCIQVEKCLDNYVLRHCKPGDKSQKWNTSMTLSDVSVPSNTVQFQEDGKLYAEVTCVMSANEIWCRQLSTEESEVYTEMIAKMEAYYNQHAEVLKAQVITEAGYYVTNYENMWVRVRAVGISEKEVHCFFIDFGDEMSIPTDNIYQLKRPFALSQAQAFVCRLVGLEELYEVSAHSEKIQSLLCKQVTLEMAVDNAAEENMHLSIPVFMYDYETGNSINQELIPLLTIESASPVIQKRATTEVYVCNIESNGDVYVQLHSPGYDSLQNLLTNLESQILTNPPTDIISRVTRENSKGKVYFAKHKADGHWYRAQLIDWSPKGELAQIYFVDYGNADVINVEKEVLYPLDKLSDVLNQYPFQAVRVKMAIDKIPDNFIELAVKAMPEDQPLLLKIVDYDNNLPLAEFFKRNADGGLFCINKSITMEVELKEREADNQKGAKKKLTQFDSSKNVPSGGSLPKPPIPDKNEYFEVHIPFAVNPYNFFVQPFASRSKLYKMMKALQERYKDVTYSPLQIDQIVPGNIYASKHEDGFWYRTSVLKVIHSGSISVYFCDFGYYANLTLQQLIPLDVEFVELPYQALKAKLSDIKPKQSKWTMADCEDFKALIERKNFYSIIRDIEKDELYDSDIVLKLILIDTSSDEDVNIGKELIKKGIAVEA